MKALTFLTLFTGLVFAFCGCCRNGRCFQNDHILNGPVTLVNFSKTEADSVVIKQYLASSNFSNPFDSSGYKGLVSDTSRYYVFIDTVYASVPDSALNLLFYFPHDSLTYKVTNITYQHPVCRRCPGRITYETILTGYNINGVHYDVSYSHAGLQITR